MTLLLWCSCSSLHHVAHGLLHTLTQHHTCTNTLRIRLTHGRPLRISSLAHAPAAVRDIYPSSWLLPPRATHKSTHAQYMSEDPAHTVAPPGPSLSTRQPLWPFVRRWLSGSRTDSRSFALYY
ncbi:hypothetical protein C8T65DRAFT_639515 [Cerioporus squamosus]|nr:hypothetical protein C8T65DRAFT_639515 [Cerioporus squamosus]